ncbi:unnamed protein product [Psylliodes chrysocephalus]|uniref:Uncharacterized protein n=1 Tax=Psylliodes chrysocephalus TaxID=3402493 RepID=A0A9P0CTF4_9CUCU|nr:unnamed protein product [Psylliodes chrysocephala]
MEAVDAIDQDLETYNFLRKSYTWSTKVGFQALQQMLLNSKVIYSNAHAKKISMYEYMKICCHEVLMKYNEGYVKLQTPPQSPARDPHVIADFPKICDKMLKCGQPYSPHVCENLCHKRPCPPCLKTTVVTCRCRHMDKELPCQELTTKADVARYEKKCTKKSTRTFLEVADEFLNIQMAQLKEKMGSFSTSSTIDLTDILNVKKKLQF